MLYGGIRTIPSIDPQSFDMGASLGCYFTSTIPGSPHFENATPMFTGIITAVGAITTLQPRGGDVRLHIATGKLDLCDVQLGDSIAVSGVCLTAIERSSDGFWADASRETLERTILGAAKPGTAGQSGKSADPDHPAWRPSGQRSRRWHRCSH